MAWHKRDPAAIFCESLVEFPVRMMVEIPNPSPPFQGEGDRVQSLSHAGKGGLQTSGRALPPPGRGDEEGVRSGSDAA
jgi:hypothetical protein